VPADADLEIGLRWDRTREALFANLRFDVPGENTERWEQPDEPIALDLAELRKLDSNEPAYGEALTRMLLRPDDVGRFYQDALTLTESSELTLHLRLHINAPAPFHSVRWESLRDPKSGDRIATRSTVLLSRYLSSPDWRPIPVYARHDLRALAVVAGPSDIGGYAPRGSSLAEVKVEEELERASAALATFNTVQKLGRGQATLAAMLAALDKGVDVLYLVCHGAVSEDVPLIYLEGPDGKADIVDGRKLVERLLGLERRPTVVMLCSCQSAAAGDELWSEDEGDLAALGPRLAAAGVSAVVGMQGNVTMETAGTFAPAFFEALAKDGIVDRAMAVARRSIADRSDWWVPVLFSRLRSGRTYYKPEFAERGEATWQTLRLQIETGNFTPVLGPGLADGILGSRQDIARGFVERWQMPLARHSQGDLAQVAQYLRVRSAEGTVRAQLFDYLATEIAKRRDAATGPEDPYWELELDRRRPGPSIVEVGRRLRKNDPGDPYRVLAELPVDVYVTTAWTNLLQDALRNREGGAREPTTMVFRWNDLGANGQSPQDLVEEPSFERPLVYHLFGRFDHPRSLVLTEEDYFAWFTAWHTRRLDIPPVIRSSLVEKSLLFMGFRLDDWDFRVIFQAIKSFGGSQLMAQNLHVGVQLSPENQLIEPEAAQEYLESYFGDDKVSIYWGDTRRFLDELRARTGLKT
jgi:hypothetical protein